MRSAVPFLLTALLAPMAASAARGQDRVDLRVGAPLAGQVLSEDYKKVKIKVRGGAEKDVPAAAVVDVVRDDAPDSYREGRAELNRGNAENAVALLQLAAREGKAPWVKEYASFHLGDALRMADQTAEAVRAYEAVTAANAESRLLPRAVLGAARAELARQSHAAAQSRLESFLREVDLKGLPRIYSVAARLLLGKVLAAQRKFDDAAAAFQRVAGAADNQVRTAEHEGVRAWALSLAFEARQEEARAYLALDDHSRAGAAFRKIATANPDDPAAQAIAQVGEAEVEMARGRFDAARVKLTEVLAAHFWVDAVQPRAHYLLAQAYVALDKEGEKGSRDLARSYLQDLVKRYPNSDWSSKGRRLLEELQ